MTVVLAAINARFTHSSLALRYLRQAVEDGWADREDSGGGQSNDQLRLAEYQINQPRLQILEAIVGHQPDVLLLSVSIWCSGLVQLLLPDLRALLPRGLIILGGPEVSWQTETWLPRFPAIDLIVRGPGEAAIRLLASHSFDLGAARSAKPVAFSGAGFRVMQLAPPDFRTQAFPWRDEDFAVLADRYLYYESSRGCPFACAYCLSARDDQPLQLKPTTTTCAELALILQHRPMLVKLVDRTFNADPARAREIWQFLAEQDNGFTKFHFEIHPALLEEADFDLLATVRPGLFQFEVGVQSVNPKALAAIARPVDWPTARASIARLIKLATVPVHLDLIVGLPGEGMAEIWRSFDEVLALRPNHFQLGFLKALPGTPIMDQISAMAMVHQAEAPYEILANRWLGPAELAELRVVEDLLDATCNAGIGMDLIAAGAGRLGSAFGFFRHLAALVRKIGYDVRTRQASKVTAFLDAGLLELPHETSSRT